MEENNLKELWKSTNAKLEETLLLSRKNTEDITKMKVQSLLSSMKPMKNFTLLVGMIWFGLGSVIITNLFIFAYAKVSAFFFFSAGIQLLLTAIAIVVYFYQLILIRLVDVSESVVATQNKLARLKSSTLWVARILFLQLPVWTTFYLSENIFKNGQPIFYLVQGIVTFSFTYIALWLFFNIKIENTDKKWFKLIFNGKEWTAVIKSIELYKEVEEFKMDN